MKNKFTYFVTRFSMFGIGFFLIFQSCGKDAWLAILLGTLLGIIVIYFYSKLKILLDTSDSNIIKNIFKFIMFLFYILLMIITLMLLPLFVNSFYLTLTPKLIVNIPFLILTIYISFKGKDTLLNLSNILYFISIIIILFFAVALINYVEFDYLKPILSTKTNNVLLSSLIYAAISSIPQIITIQYQKDFKSILKDYLLASLSIFMIVIFTILSLGDSLLKIYSFPEYTVLRQIKVLNFIENIENISAFIWYFDLFIALSTLTFNVKDVLPKKYNLISFYLVMVFVLLTSSLLIGKNYVYILNIVYCYPVILSIFLALFIILAIILKLNHNKKIISKL